MNDTCRIKKNQFWFEISCIDCILKACYEDILESSLTKIELGQSGIFYVHSFFL